MRVAGAKAGDIDRIQAWAGQAAALAQAKPAGEVIRGLWEDARALLTS
jgi:nitronate monooxygenase